MMESNSALMEAPSPEKMVKVAVMGTGKVGRLVAYLLGASGDYAVTALDVSENHAQAAVTQPDGSPLPNSAFQCLDFSDEAAIAEAMRGQDYVLSCAPYRFNVGIARAARQAGVSYLDLTEDVATTKEVMALSKGADSAFIPQCGLAPGFISIVAHSLAQRFDTLESVKLRVGALPRYPNNRLKYNLTWSTDGLINEYGNPCEAVVDGKLVTLPALEGHEHFVIDGESYEAFNTSGGLGTLADTWAGQVRNLDYKTIRYPGHRDIMALLMNDLRMNEDRETLKRIFEKALPRTLQDMVVIFVTATGMRRGKFAEEAYARKIFSADIGGRRWGAIQVTTASGICAVLDMHANGLLPKTGFVRQEQIVFEDFINNRFGRAYV